MVKNQKNVLIGLLYFIGATMVILGAVFKMLNLPHDFTIIVFGFIVGSIAGVFDNMRLKKRIKELEEQYNN